ncbi:centrosomal protein of 164 kDa isoform X2 [Hyperolius riggenbachi]|uniref:centrosomal protein of 164 kDa isoform X2 n=1 Tax=Hyperolius riggenbachi TaxID=752182 RepID=UPI0035A27ADD
MLAVPAGRMGDQLILEEDHDENYIPQDNEIQEYARMVGIDPDAEPELMWLAREGIVAPLPPDWKPCQDVTGDIYYFNFATGQSSWDHPIDEHYRDLVLKEREKMQTQGGGKKREKKKKEKKKEKKAKEFPKPIMSLGSPLGPVQGPLGSLAPLRTLGDSAGSLGGIRGSLGSSTGSSGGFDSLLVGTAAPQKSQKPFIKPTTGKQAEERVSLSLPGLEEEDEDGDQESEDQSPRGSARLLKNLHMDIGSLGGGFEYERGMIGSRNAQPDHQDQDCVVGREVIPQVGERELIHSATPAEMSAHKEESVPGSPDIDSKQGNASANTGPSLDGKLGSSSGDCILGKNEQDESESTESVKDVPKPNTKALKTMDFGLGKQSLENVLDVADLTPQPTSSKETIEEELNDDIEEVVSEDDHIELDKGSLDKTERQIYPDIKRESTTVAPKYLKEPFKTPTELFRVGTESSKELEKDSKQKSDLSKPIVQPAKLTDQPAKASDDSTRMNFEKEKIGKEEEHKQKLEELRLKHSKEEEEEKRKLQQLHESNLRALEEKLKRELEDEESKMRESQKQRLLKLEQDFVREREEEEQIMKKRKEEIKEEHRQLLQKLEESQKENVLQEKNALLEKLKLETGNLLSKERATQLNDRETALEELRNKLQLETKKALKSLEKQHEEELEQMKAAAAEKHQKELSEVQNAKPSLQLLEASQTTSDLHLANKKMAHVLDFEREMSDLLQEKRNEVQREHERKLEHMKEEHRQELEKVRKQFEDEEQNQRTQMLERLKDELGRLTRQHEQELEIERQKQEKSQEERQRNYREKENMLTDLEQNQEIRRKQLLVKASHLDSQEGALRKRQEDLLEKEKELEQKTENVHLLENEVKEQKRLNELIKQTRRELEEMQNRKSELDAQLEQLQSRYVVLQKTASDLEDEIKRRQEELKALNKEEPMNNMDSELRLEDLTKLNSTNHTSIPNHIELPKTSLSPTTIPGMDTSVEDLRCYISSQGASIQKAKDFLRLQTHSMCRRQTLLKAAKQQWRHNMHDAQDTDQVQQLEGIRKSLEKEDNSLKDIGSTMAKGQFLLQEKEHYLHELENSLQEEISEDETPKGKIHKKVVTFDVSDSDDTSSVTSIDMLRGNSLGSQNYLPMKVKSLTQSLNHITTELNNVLSSLCPHTSEPHALLHSDSKLSSASGIPISTFVQISKMNPESSLHSSSPWAWKTGAHPSVSASSSAAQSVDAFMMEKWRKYFPESSPFYSDHQSVQTENKFGYVSAGDQLKDMQSASFHSKYTDQHSIQDMIDSNKKWLKHFKNDPKVPLSSHRSPTRSGLVQLGLDENNQIRVYQY